VDREKLLDISGRSRKMQMELAKNYGITNYPQPASGCLLTDPGYSKRLRELIDHTPDPDIRDIKFLGTGRHFRLKTGEKAIIGRDRTENRALLSMKNSTDAVIDVVGYKSPIAVIPHGASKEAIKKAAAICARYSDCPKDQEIRAICHHKDQKNTFLVMVCPDKDLDEIRI